MLPVGGLSICPSQLSSMPLQISCWDVTVGALQTVSVPAALQTRIPSRLQAPMRPLLHLAPTGPVGQEALSMPPSQLSSRPLHFSAGTAQPQGPPQALTGSPSSTCPLQLSSRQLQVSIAQCLTEAPFTLSGSEGLLGLITKLPQAGLVFPAVQVMHWLETPSSICPLQLSSFPLQTSTGGTFWAMIPTMALLAAFGSFSETRMEALVPPAAAMASLALSAVVSVMT